MKQVALTAQRAQADEIVRALGTDYMAVSGVDRVVVGVPQLRLDGISVEPDRTAWRVRYTRAVSGVPTIYTDFECFKVEREDQTSPIAYESMTFSSMTAASSASIGSRRTI